ncbi:hypothetical protein BC828DRAFT_339044, partial [Blastocladiella britannica]
ALIAHVKDTHIGRGAKGTVILCHWRRKPHAGAVCTVVRSKRDHLVSHLIKHISARPYACEHCGLTFKRKQNVVQH